MHQEALARSVPITDHFLKAVYEISVCLTVGILGLGCRGGASACVRLLKHLPTTNCGSLGTCLTETLATIFPFLRRPQMGQVPDAAASRNGRSP